MLVESLMPAFVERAPAEAGPRALGILVPPGKRTLIILRPRALSWDLVLERPPGAPQPGLWELHPLEAKPLVGSLRALLANGKSVNTELVQAAAASHFQVRVGLGELRLVVCDRATGQPYCPSRFKSEAEARRVEEMIKAILSPGADANHELYCNTRHFSS
jgi:hypothetical protein